jgi:hypothetical protein
MQEAVQDLARHTTRYEITPHISIFETDRYRLSKEKGVLVNTLVCLEDELRILKNQYVQLTTTLKDLVQVVNELADTNQRNLSIVLDTGVTQVSEVRMRVYQLHKKGETSKELLLGYLRKLNAKWNLGLPAMQCESDGAPQMASFVSEQGEHHKPQ